MKWNKTFDRRDRKKFLHLIDYLVEAIHNGDLAGGESLPSQRELARLLGLSIGTITKAIKELEKMGYLVGEVGRGTYVRDVNREFSEYWYNESHRPYQHNLGHYRTTELFNHSIQMDFLKSVREVVGAEDLYLRMHDLRNFGTEEQKAAFNAWLKPLGMPDLPASNLSILSAEVLSILVVVEALTASGDTVLMEEVGDRITRDQLLAIGRHVGFVKMDEEGLLPDDLSSQLDKSNSRLLITNPTFHNPTGVTTKASRKRAIAGICAAKGTYILEDGKVDAFYGQAITPYYQINPDIGIYLTGLYFHINPSLTTSVVVANQQVIKRLEDFYAIAYWSGSQLLQSIAAHLITSGHASRIIEHKRRLLRARNLFYNETFSQKGMEYSPLRWLSIGQHHRSSEFAQRAYDRGVLVRQSDIFALDSSQPPSRHVRIVNAAIHKEMDYRKAIATIDELLHENPGSEVLR